LGCAIVSVFKKTNADVNKLTDSNSTELNILKKQVKVIKHDRDEGPEILINVTNDLKEMRNMTSKANMKSFLAYHFIQINLIGIRIIFSQDQCIVRRHTK